jgi:phenylacetic acid degradation operon negative regulatory protein
VAQLKAVERLVQAFSLQRPLRGGSLIITVFGDSISQHGNSVWLGSLIKVLEPFGLNSRLIRTAVHRLVQEDWLRTRMVGRRSYYSFTESGLRRYEKAAQRIYAGSPPPWDGHWTLLICNDMDEDKRDLLRKELTWLGYGAINSNTLLHPGNETRDLHETLSDIGVVEKVIVMNADTSQVSSQKAMRDLALQAWPLAQLAQRYDEFLQRFRPVLKALRSARQLDPLDAFQARTLLVHEYRRILLRDSDLPQELLPANWVGGAALNLVTNIYRATGSQCEAYLEQTMETSEGPLPRAGSAYQQRFGGL